MEPSTETWLKRERENEAATRGTEIIKIANGDAAVEVAVKSVQEPKIDGTFVHSISVVVVDNERWSISVQSRGTSLNRGTHDKPVQGVSILVTATLETTWETTSTQTLVSISADGTISAN